MEPTSDFISSVEPRQPLRLEQLRELVNAYAAGRLSLGRFDRAGRALLRRQTKEPAMMFARAFLLICSVFAVACGTPPEPAPAAVVAVQSDAKPGCRWLATVSGLRCLPSSNDIFWESDSQRRVLDLGDSFLVMTPDNPRWIIFLSDGVKSPSVVYRIVLLPVDVWRATPTELQVPHSIESVTVSLDWFGSQFE